MTLNFTTNFYLSRKIPRCGLIRAGIVTPRGGVLRLRLLLYVLQVFTRIAFKEIDIGEANQRPNCLVQLQRSRS